PLLEIQQGYLKINNVSKTNQMASNVRVVNFACGIVYLYIFFKMLRLGKNAIVLQNLLPIVK
ncbi:MAG: hypothetical protein ACJ702_03010, partial [Nitrososphaeraceae archaeon]